MRRERCDDVQTTILEILFAAGGTGGHLYPALAIADEVKRLWPETHLTFVGTDNAIEARVVPMRGYSFVPIWISGFQRRLALENLLFPLKVAVSLGQSFRILRRMRPQVVVGTGGYVCGPVLYAATVLGRPTLIQEQNSYPGVTTRLLASRVNEVHIAFESARRHLKGAFNVKLTGNPTRSSLGTVSKQGGRTFFGLEPEKKTLLVLGGSAGARSINTAVRQILPHLVGLGLQVLWQTGTEDFDRIKNAVDEMPGEIQIVTRVYKFIESMEFAYGACDLAVCRAGATTIAELARAGVPSLLVPYPYAAADHQTHNATSAANSGASVMLADNEMERNLFRTVRTLIDDPAQLQRMSERARAMSRPAAAETLARAVIALARQGYDGTGKSLQIQT
jgi:UDP-N-acetylglucosamine--N-acetylmuramyl-(pentapeptide) pyrophosphoryl-undecaprenol N-acetylglucosamine transferase